MNWIDVNDELPERGVDVLVWNICRTRCYMAYLSAIDNVWMSNIEYRMAVSHWMPYQMHQRRRRDEMLPVWNKFSKWYVDCFDRKRRSNAMQELLGYIEGQRFIAM